MKHCVRFLTFLFSILLFLSVLLCTASAAEPETHYQMRMKELYAVWDRYRAKESAIGDATPTANLIWYDYYHQLGPEFPSAEYENTVLIDLIYYKGISAAPLAWIYYSHKDTIGNEAVQAVFEAQLGIINGQNTETAEEVRTAFFLGSEEAAPGVYDCYTALLNSIYLHRLEQLRRVDDSAASAAIITLAQDRLRGTDTSVDSQNPTPSFTQADDEDAANYQAYLLATAAQVTRQRNRDTLNEQMTAICRKLFPDASFSKLEELAASDAILQTFTEELPHTDSIVQLNSLLGRTVTALLDRLAESSDRFTKQYLGTTLKQQVTIGIANASGAGLGPILADLDSTCFGATYALELAKAQSKDALSASAAAIPNVPADKQALLDRLVEEYQAERFTTCLSLAQLHEEVARANQRLTWFSDHLQALASLAEVLTRFDSPRLTEEMRRQLTETIEQQYADTDRAVRDGTATALTEGKAALAQAVQDAECLAFTVKHPIVQSSATVTKADLTALSEAIADADRLSPNAEAALEQESLLTRLGERYRTAARDAVTAALPTDGGDGQPPNQLIRDCLTHLNQALAALSCRTPEGELSLSDLMTAANTIIARAKQTGNVLCRYRDLLQGGADCYTDAMERVCDAAVRAILAGEEGDHEATALRMLEQLSVLEQIRDAADGKTAVAAIASVITAAEADLLPDAATPPSDLVEYLENALFRIDNRWCAEQMRLQTEQLQQTLRAMTDLTDGEKQIFQNRIGQIGTYLEELSRVTDKHAHAAQAAQAQDAGTRAIALLRYALTQIRHAEVAYRENLTQIHALDKPDDAQKAAWRAEAASAYRQCLQTISVGETDADADSALLLLRRLLATVLSAATQEDLRLTKVDACNGVRRRAEEWSQTVMAYSFTDLTAKQKFLTRIRELAAQACTAIENCADTTAVAQAERAAEDAWQQLLRDAEEIERLRCRSYLSEQLNGITHTRTEYSAEQFAAVEALVRDGQALLAKDATAEEYQRIYEATMARIRAIPTRMDEAREDGFRRFGDAYQLLLARKDNYSADAFATVNRQYTLLLRELSRSDLYASAADIPTFLAKVEEAIAALRAVRLDSVSTETDSEYSGTITAPDQIPSDLLLTVNASEQSHDDLQKAIRRAAKLHSVLLADGSLADRSLLRLLKSCLLTASADFSFDCSALADGASYTVSLQLPRDCDLSNIIGIVYLREDGGLEFLDATVNGSSIAFTTTHFSEYYVVSAKIANLWPLLVALSILITAELAVLAFLLWRRMRRTKKSASLAAWIFPSALLIRHRPQGGIAAAWILGLIACGLGIWIAVWLWEERTVVKERRKPAALGKSESDTQRLPSATAVSVTPSIAAPNTAVVPRAVSTAPIPLPRFSPMTAVSAEDADAMMSDEEAREHLQADRDHVDLEPYRGTKRAQINLDRIAEHFAAGDTVTLNRLKEKKLLPSNVGAVKILARGTLDKPLTVLAQDFSASALKMILLTGGTPIRTHGSPERENRRRVR